MPWPGPTTRVLAFFDEDRPEAFFVKNLERVQGDERDDVILTIGYGKTPHGRVLHRFGPLNLEGGERRLNVAITRARRSMTVVSSIAADDLDPARLRARGAAHAARLPRLRGGRSAARCRRASTAPDAVGAAVPRPRSVVLSDLARRLRGHGLVVHEDVGSSADPVDLAVEDPDAPRSAAAGGGVATGRSTPRCAPPATATGCAAEQLERLGWRHLRVWSTDVFRDPARDVARILEAAGVRRAPGD